MNLFKASATHRIAQFCLLALPIGAMTTFAIQPSFAEPNPNGCNDAT
jgi:hypothetical protein